MRPYVALLPTLALVLTWPVLAQPAEYKDLPRLTKVAYVALDTSKGLILLELSPEAPLSSGNFLDLVKRKFYNGLIFHRVVPNFVVQGGDPKGTGEGGFVDPVTKKDRTIPLEIKFPGQKVLSYGVEVPNAKPVLSHNKGALAWARSNLPNSASSQFYINLADVKELDGRYAVFGRVIKGMDVVEKITQGDKIITATEVKPTVKK